VPNDPHPAKQSSTELSAAGPTLGRAAVERVLARAAELHNATDGSGDPAQEVSEAQLLEIGREVGLSATSVKQALAEERTRVGVDADTGAGWVTRIAGPRTLSATRMVTGTPAAILSALDTWMQREEGLQVQRRFSDRVVWEARSDWFNTLRRNLRIGGREYQLGRAQCVGATVIAVDEQRVLVRLDADITPHRTMRLRLGATAGAGSVLLAGSAVPLLVAANAALFAVGVVAIIPLGLGGVAGYAALRQHQHFATRTLLALEQALDRLEFSDTRAPSTLLDVVAAIRPLVR